MADVNQIMQMLAACTVEQRRQVFDYLRAEFSIHPIEGLFNTKAEVILEAIARASDLTLRGVRGVIAEAAFDEYVVKDLITSKGWESLPILGDPPYDFLLQDIVGQVRVQLKMQRLKQHRPMMARQAYSWLSPDMHVVETQRTRGGVDRTTGQSTRPYRFGEFDTLGVSLHPSSNDWRSFMYTVADWLLPSRNNDTLMLKFQPVAPQPNDDWTNSFETSVQWFRQSITKRIQA